MVFPFAIALNFHVILDVSYYKRAFHPPSGSIDWPSLKLTTSKENLILFHEINAMIMAPDQNQAWWEWYRNVASNAQSHYGNNTQITYVNSATSYGSMYLQNPCIQSLFPDFYACVLKDPVCPQDPLYALVFDALFRYPSAALHSSLNKIRKRLELPYLPAGTEPQPGAWGLRTPGTYLLALHFRALPGGFEPMVCLTLLRV